MKNIQNMGLLILAAAVPLIAVLPLPDFWITQLNYIGMYSMTVLGLILLTGLFGLMRMGQKEDPDFTFRVMVVQAFWPGASLTDMQDQVVNKIERKLQETPYLDWVKSYTRPGSAIITLQVITAWTTNAPAGGMPISAPANRLIPLNFL